MYKHCHYTTGSTAKAFVKLKAVSLKVLPVKAQHRLYQSNEKLHQPKKTMNIKNIKINT